MPPFLVRQAVESDAPGIAKVHTDTWRTTYRGIVSDTFLANLNYEQRTANARRKMTNPEITALVVVKSVSNEVVGFVDVGPSREKNLSVKGEMYAIYLLEEFQGQGIGRMLFEAGAKALKDRAFEDFFVSVLSENLKSVEFYRKMGGQLIGHDHVDIEDIRHKTDTFFWKFA